MVRKVTQQEKENKKAYTCEIPNNEQKDSEVGCKRETGGTLGWKVKQRTRLQLKYTYPVSEIQPT